MECVGVGEADRAAGKQNQSFHLTPVSQLFTRVSCAPRTPSRDIPSAHLPARCMQNTQPHVVSPTPILLLQVILVYGPTRPYGVRQRVVYKTKFMSRYHALSIISHFTNVPNALGFTLYNYRRKGKESPWIHITIS